MDSTDNSRTVNNVLRHEYRVLTDEEKQQMKDVKDPGLVFHEYLNQLKVEEGHVSLDLTQARIKIEEAVMWAVKHITR